MDNTPKMMFNFVIVDHLLFIINCFFSLFSFIRIILYLIYLICNNLVIFFVLFYFSTII